MSDEEKKQVPDSGSKQTIPEKPYIGDSPDANDGLRKAMKIPPKPVEENPNPPKEDK